jgi:hypothetical protein
MLAFCDIYIIVIFFSIFNDFSLETKHISLILQVILRVYYDYLQYQHYNNYRLLQTKYLDVIFVT